MKEKNEKNNLVEAYRQLGAPRQVLIMGAMTPPADTLAEFMQDEDGTLRRIQPLSGATHRRCLMMVPQGNITADDFLDYWTRDDNQNLRFKLSMLPTLVANHPGRVVLESRCGIAPELLKSCREKAKANDPAA